MNSPMRSKGQTPSQFAAARTASSRCPSTRTVTPWTRRRNTAGSLVSPAAPSGPPRAGGVGLSSLTFESGSTPGRPFRRRLE
jgi:hypothetical protein